MNVNSGWSVSRALAKAKLPSLVTVAAMCLVVGANASTLPAATSSVDVIAGNPGVHVSDPTNASLPGASGSVTIAPFVSVQAQVSDDPGANLGQSATSILTYFFSVSGGTVGDVVPVDVTTNLLTTASAEPAPGSTAFYGFARLTVGDQSANVCTDPTQCAQTQFAGTLALTARSGIDQIQVSFEIIAEGNPFFAGTASASGDPLIFIDPSVSGYSIELSDGVANGLLSSTPLPAALPLFATGLGAMGLLGWRRKRKAAAIAAA